MRFMKDLRFNRTTRKAGSILSRPSGSPFQEGGHAAALLDHWHVSSCALVFVTGYPGLDEDGSTSTADRQLGGLLSSTAARRSRISAAVHIAETSRPTPKMTASVIDYLHARPG